MGGRLLAVALAGVLSGCGGHAADSLANCGGDAGGPVADGDASGPTAADAAPAADVDAAPNPAGCYQSDFLTMCDHLSAEIACEFLPGNEVFPTVDAGVDAGECKRVRVIGPFGPNTIETVFYCCE